MEKLSRLLTIWAWTFAAVWTVVLVASLLWYWFDAESRSREVAIAQARTAFMKDVVYRRWNAGSKGVFVPISPQVPSNPYLKVKNRDITASESGVKLTMINPAYMTRQVHEIQDIGRDGFVGHITSNRPIRPENEPDWWESQALAQFEKGAKEVVSEHRGTITSHVLRFMRPLYVEEVCMKCHAAQGYKVGEVRGGISVTVPMAARMMGAYDMQTIQLGVHFLVWLLGLAGIFVGFSSLRRAASESEVEEES